MGDFLVCAWLQYWAGMQTLMLDGNLFLETVELKK
jgi:hypothetical protein